MITDQHRKQLQHLMSQPEWTAFEVAFNNFLNVNFLQQSIKREDSFHTLSYAAEYEGGKRALQDFKNSLEIEAKQV